VSLGQVETQIEEGSADIDAHSKNSSEIADTIIDSDIPFLLPLCNIAIPSVRFFALIYPLRVHLYHTARVLFHIPSSILHYHTMPKSKSHLGKRTVTSDHIILPATHDRSRDLFIPVVPSREFVSWTFGRGTVVRTVSAAYKGEFINRLLVLEVVACSAVAHSFCCL
jgi:hypothetical protein